MSVKQLAGAYAVLRGGLIRESTVSENTCVGWSVGVEAVHPDCKYSFSFLQHCRVINIINQIIEKRCSFTYFLSCNLLLPINTTWKMLAVELMKVIFEVEMTYNHFHEVLITHPAEMEKRCSLTIKAPETP